MEHARVPDLRWDFEGISWEGGYPGAQKSFGGKGGVANKGSSYEDAEEVQDSLTHFGGVRPPRK